MHRTMERGHKSGSPKHGRLNDRAAARYGIQHRRSPHHRAMKLVRSSAQENRAVRPTHPLHNQHHRSRHRREAAAVHRAAAEGRGIDMSKTTMIKLSVLFAASIVTAGCYTKLMTPQEFVQTQRYQVKRTYSDNSYSLNYNQSCVSCHSTNELNERYDELSQLGVMSVHNGIPFEPSRWENTVAVQHPIILIADPDPYWPGPASPVNPWWSPPVTNSSAPTAPAAGNGNRIRENGPNRDGNRNGERDAPIPSPTYSQPQSGGSSSAPLPTAPPSTVNSTPTPAPQPAQTSSGDRSRDSNSSSGSTERTRDNGASRDSGGSRPR